MGSTTTYFCDGCKKETTVFKYIYRRPNAARWPVAAVVQSPMSLYVPPDFYCTDLCPDCYAAVEAVLRIEETRGK